MAESFLEEQLKRMKEMSEQMSRFTNRAAELSNELARNRESSHQGPLEDVRDLRTYPPKESRARSDDRAPNPRRHKARHSSRGRR